MPPEVPEGFVYQPEFLSEADERQLLDDIAKLSFRAFEFQGYTAKRRIVAYGWDYDFTARKTSETERIPDYLMPLRKRVAEFAAAPEDDFVEAVVIEYPPGAPIGWHRDVPQFEMIVGVSLRSACRMRLKPYQAEGKLVSITLEPRSIYILQGAVRWQFQHSIPAVRDLRYSITFRTLRKAQQSRKAS